MSRVAADTGMEVCPVLQVFGKLAVMIILVNLYKRVQAFSRQRRDLIHYFDLVS